METNNLKYFNLYSNCIITTGFKQTIISDLSENTFFFIPNLLGKILAELRIKSIDVIKRKYNNEFDNEIDGFLNNLISKNIGFYYSSTSNFSALNTVWEAPYKISNIIISTQLSQKLQIKLDSLIDFNIDCLGINIPEYSTLTIELIKEITRSISFNTFQLFIYSSIDEDNIKILAMLFPKLTHIYVLNTKVSSVTQYDGITIVYDITKQYINQNNFIVNIPLFTESQRHNTYFNRKLYIGPDGEIKNAPECDEVYANINNLKSKEEILTIIDNKAFQKYWYINKGLVDVCKQCEYRHMCIDNRVPIQRNEKEWFMEGECNYNPYIAKWKEEEGYKTLEECGIRSDANGFNVNRKRLNNINKELWENE